MITERSLSERLESRLLLYALAAGATLAATPSSHAEVLFTPSNAILEGLAHFTVDLDHDGTVDFYFDLNKVCTYSCYTRFDSMHVYGNQILNQVAVDEAGNAEALRRTARIQSGRAFQKKAFMVSASGLSKGNWDNVRDRFLGVKFLINGEVHTGWIGFRGVKSDVNNWTVTAALAGFAYETEPDKSIVAGDKGTAAPLDGPSSIGLLARGQAARQDWRQRKGH